MNLQHSQKPELVAAICSFSNSAELRAELRGRLTSCPYFMRLWREPRLKNSEDQSCTKTFTPFFLSVDPKNFFSFHPATEKLWSFYVFWINVWLKSQIRFHSHLFLTWFLVFSFLRHLFVRKLWGPKLQVHKIFFSLSKIKKKLFPFYPATETFWWKNSKNSKAKLIQDFISKSAGSTF